MIWCVLISGGMALGLIFFNVQPAWVQYLGLGVSLSLFVTYLLQDAMGKSAGAGAWMRKKGIFWLVLVLVAIASFLSRRYEVAYDFTQYKSYSLRQQTIDWLNQLKSPVRILIFLTSDDKTIPYAEWLQEQCNKYTPFIKVEIKSINKEIVLARQYEVRKAGQTILVSQDNWVKVETFKEMELVPGLMRLLARTSSSLCFLSGHGEPDIRDESEKGLNSLRTFLEDVGYSLRTLSLDQTDPEAVKKACGVLLVISPRTAFLPVEESRLAQIMKDSTLPIFFALDAPTPQTLARLIKAENVGLTERFVMNRDNLAEKTPLTDIILFPRSQVSAIVREFKGKIYLPEVQAIDLPENDPHQGLQWASFLQTPPSDKFALVGKEDQPGPFVVAASAVDKDGGPLRIIVGSGRGFHVRQLAYGENKHIILALINWLLKEDRMAWVDERQKEEVYLTLTPGESHGIRLVAVYGVPGLTFLLCFGFWLKRRWGS